MATLITGDISPRAGDIVLARVDVIGQHKCVELGTGRKARLFPNDEIILAYGNRYAPDQYEAFVPKTLEPCHMVAAGGIAAETVCKSDKVSMPTRITPLGLIADEERKVLNLSDFALDGISNPPEGMPYVLSVVGTSMNSGKTEAATQLIRGFKNAGLKVAAAKVTGTGAGPDVWSMVDAGAHPVLDFTDAGLATTYMASPEQVEATFMTLIGHLQACDPDIIVLEVADGVYQRETSALLSSERFSRMVNGVVFAAADALSAAAGVQWLRNRDLPVLAVTGLVTTSPLWIREATAATEHRFFGTESLGRMDLVAELGVTLRRQESKVAA